MKAKDLWTALRGVRSLGLAFQRRCMHENYRVRRWVQDNTPFQHFVCLDCGFEDRGHVHGDTEDWETAGWEIHRKGDNARVQG